MTTDVSRPLIIVTGGGTGMGRDIALDQTKLGHDVLIVGRRPDPLEETRSMSAAPHRLHTAVADISTHQGTTALLDAVDGRPVKAFVAAAGGQGDFKDPGTSPEEVDEAWTEALRKNLFSAILPIEAVLPLMVDGQGRIVLIGSTAGLDGAGGPYATAKAALSGYGRDLATRVGRRGITANTLAPGFVAATDFFEAGGYGASATMIEGAASQTLVGRVGQPQDITASVRWLISEDAGWVTAQTITVNGGTVIVR
ncbi:SDR family NAD(P)-dependent oxidoreductase [Prauserella alba]|uniref:SDR family oxidoreductase n=1 Tax=Prauserella alba TaxID=176898 RepID=A0ABP4G094_9PSEU|nr:SDR family oxidoreductase [Prauserella alba]MCP2180051.1 3-oxoacyl-[acyl-carrier protein] reductase [Prauserella alba]